LAVIAKHCQPSQNRQTADASQIVEIFEVSHCVDLPDTSVFQARIDLMNPSIVRRSQTHPK